MLPMRIGLVSQSSAVDLPTLVKVAAAINLQIARDVAPIWALAGTVVALQSENDIGPGVWPVYIVDELNEDLAGFHLTDHGQPYAMVQMGNTWSLSVSHEVIEMLIDPSGNRLVASNAVAVVDNEVQDAVGKFEYLLEACDPSEDPSCAYLIDGVLVSDFYTPAYFDPAGTQGARYSFNGRITRPRQVLPNGYLSWYNAATNTLQQVRHFGAPVIVDIAKGRPGGGSLTSGRALRSFVDRVTRPPQTLSNLPSSVDKVQERDQRLALLDGAGAGRAQMFLVAARTATAALTSAAAAPPAAPDIPALIQANLAVFSKAGVLSVRAGIRFDIQAKAGQPVIVVNVLKDKEAELRAALPSQIGGVPLDVREANAMQVMRARQPAMYLAMANARHELRQPDFSGEVFFNEDGSQAAADPAPLAAFAAAHAAKPQLPYKGPVSENLDPVTGKVSLILHVSPDAGWSELSKFLAGIGEELVVGMYDFTSAHILTALENALGSDKKLTLTLDHPAPNPTRDQTDEETQKALSEDLGARFQSAWALIRSDPKAPVWIYPNAYHIKVAVREDDTFWLSSGNWNNSNQPEIDLTDLAAAKKIAANHDRDWHVIVTNTKLAQKFRAYLTNDYDVAHGEEEGAPAIAGLAMASALSEVPMEVMAAGRVPRKFFAPKTLEIETTIQPLLTPDNYVDHVMPLIQSAQQRFYMQTQYIHPSGKPGDENHDALIAAVKERIVAGVDVRLITSEYQTDDWVEKVAQAGIQTSVLRRQPKVHNKGVVVDSNVVMVSSQNWSADGTLRNRDAGLIIHNAEAANYFEQIFLHDWDFLASPVSGT